MKKKSQERSMCRLPAIIAALILLFFWNVGMSNVQTGSTQEQKGFVLFETFQGDTDAAGTITKLDTMTGYKFNRHFEIDAGLPFYFVRPSAESIAQGATSDNGIGNAYLRMRFTAGHGAASFESSLTGTAPTGDSGTGFSTGRVTVDWNNYLGYTAGRITPFMNVGLANSLSDTRFFMRPFTTLGSVAHFEGGADVAVWRIVSVGASAYADTPFGQQKVYSKLISHGHSNPQGQGMSMASGRGQKRGVFETQSVAVGDASIARDNGGSVWLDVNPRGVLNFEVGYSRSVEYDLNSVFFSIGLNLGNWIHSRY